jgi:amidohydrolase
MIVDIKKIIDLRMKLHRMAELSWNEEKTINQIEKFFQRFHPSSTLQLAKNGRAFIFDSGNPGKTTVFRAELDALPIDEPTTIFNRSLTKNVSHKCGHDGHMAILTGLGETIANDKPQKGKVILLFQPAEETLDGARTVIEDKNFANITPDFIFALHNLPNYPANSVIIKKHNFTIATNGVSIKLFGKQAHAANPQNAIDPTIATIKLLQFLRADILKYNYKNYVLSTPVYTRIGSENFGITPGNSEIKVTLRATDYSDLDKMIAYVQDQTKKIAFNYNLKYKIQYTDDAPPVYNNNEAVEYIIEAAKLNNIPVIETKTPLKWAEDFGYFSLKYKAALFGLGIGDSPELHDELYQFPDNSIIYGIKIFYSIYKKLNF